MAGPRVGEIVHYRLTTAQAREINQHRVNDANSTGEFFDKGVQKRHGNHTSSGDVVPLVVVRVWVDEFPPGCSVGVDYDPGREEPYWETPLSGYGVNGQALLDGEDSLWVTSAAHGDFPGGWNYAEPGECVCPNCMVVAV